MTSSLYSCYINKQKKLYNYVHTSVSLPSFVSTLVSMTLSSSLHIDSFVDQRRLSDANSFPVGGVSPESHHVLPSKSDSHPASTREHNVCCTSLPPNTPDVHILVAKWWERAAAVLLVYR